MLAFLHFNGAWLSLEPVRHVDSVLLLVAVGENVCALDGLVEVSEDIVDDDDGLSRVGGARHVGLVAADLFVGALGLVPLLHDGRDIAAGLIVAVACMGRGQLSFGHLNGSSFEQALNVPGEEGWRGVKLIATTALAGVMSTGG